MRNLTIFAALAFIIGAGVGAVCPATYADLGTGCYHFTFTENLNWGQAYFSCQLESNGYLVEIESEEEQTNLEAFIKDIIDPNTENYWWIGGSDMLQETRFRWMTSGNELTYTAWNPADAPGNTTNYSENCMAIFSSYNFLWRDYSCSMTAFQTYPMKAICETGHIE